MSLTQGGQTPGQRGLTRRRLDAGEAETAEKVHLHVTATKREAESIYELLGTSRSSWW